MSVYGQRNSDQRAPNKNEQPLYEYYYYDDEYYYADDLSNNANTQAPLATASTNIKPQKVAAVTEETDSLSEAKEAIAQYDIDELVIAWREYMEEKEQKEKEEEKTSRYHFYITKYHLCKVFTLKSTEIFKCLSIFHIFKYKPNSSKWV